MVGMETYMNLLELVELYRTDTDALVNLQFIVWALVLGFIISFFITYYRRRVIGSLVRSIREAEAIDPESAKTLEELGQEDNVSAISAVQKSSSLRRLITIINEDEEDSAERNKKKIKIDANTRFYISKEGQDQSRIQYGEENEKLWPMIVGSIVLIGIGILSFFIGK